ncbi:MAG: hypothetical protein QGH57_01815, partial [Candidatus Thalassarchaeaceae archaeon]|nr:hypothetical protein [Candidatus Thalassarchaeaceae archaeon]
EWWSDLGRSAFCGFAIVFWIVWKLGPVPAYFIQDWADGVPFGTALMFEKGRTISGDRISEEE